MTTRLPAWLSDLPIYHCKSSVPLKLPTKRPPCFDSQGDWAVYRRLAQFTGGDGFTYCTDCNPVYKAQMQAEGRCKYPATVFVKVSTVIVGRRRRTTQ